MKGLNERLLFEVLDKAYPGEWKTEYKGIDGRNFRFDCANPSKKIAIEIEGGIWLGKNGGHTGGIGYTQNMEKYNLAVLEGWKVLRYSPATLKKAPGVILANVQHLCKSNIAHVTTRNDIRAKLSEDKTLQQRLF